MPIICFNVNVEFPVSEPWSQYCAAPLLVACFPAAAAAAATAFATLVAHVVSLAVFGVLDGVVKYSLFVVGFA